MIGKSYKSSREIRKNSGGETYTGDIVLPGMGYGALKGSPHAHARILSVDTSAAERLPGVWAVITGADIPENIGIYTGDKCPLAREKTRHFGEAVAAVAAESRAAALAALQAVKVEYEPLPVLLSPEESLDSRAPLVHPDLESYSHIDAILPEPGTNIANRTRIRKGAAGEALHEAPVTASGRFFIPMGDHGAMEPRATLCRIGSGGEVELWSSTQAPFVVRGLLSRAFNLPVGAIRIHVPAVGGGFGGKAGIQLEALAYALSRASGGKPVKLVNSRENDMAASPGRLGLDAQITVGARRDGTLLVWDGDFLFDTGAFADYAVNITRAAAIACTGPYRVPHVRCDSLCVYTNKPFATAYRGFGHIEASFATERALDLLAERLGIDPLELRLRNALEAGDTVPTGAALDDSTGDVKACLRKAAEGIGWTATEPAAIPVRGSLVRGKGLAALWKAPAIPPNTDAGAFLTINEDGSVNISTGIVDIGQGTQDGLAQIAAAVLGIPAASVYVHGGVDTRTAPHDWTTAASRSLMMAGAAVKEAAEDAVQQLKSNAAGPLECPVEELELDAGNVVSRRDRERRLPIGSLGLGFMYPNGNCYGKPVLGRGSFLTLGLSGIDPETGAGNPALEWTLGAEAVEVELDRETGAYRILHVSGCMDVGRLINPAAARGQFTGAMMMGLGYTGQEALRFDSRGRLLTPDLRHYRLPRFDQQPRYSVDFVETPQREGPFGARGLGEQGIIGMPGALANALSRAAGVSLERLPLSPETIWRRMKSDPREGHHDSL